MIKKYKILISIGLLIIFNITAPMQQGVRALQRTVAVTAGTLLRTKPEQTTLSPMSTLIQPSSLLKANPQTTQFENLIRQGLDPKALRYSNSSFLTNPQGNQLLSKNHQETALSQQLSSKRGESNGTTEINPMNIPIPKLERRETPLISIPFDLSNLRRKLEEYEKQTKNLDRSEDPLKRLLLEYYAYEAQSNNFKDRITELKKIFNLLNLDYEILKNSKFGNKILSELKNKIEKQSLNEIKNLLNKLESNLEKIIHDEKQKILKRKETQRETLSENEQATRLTTVKNIQDEFKQDLAEWQEEQQSIKKKEVEKASTLQQIELQKLTNEAIANREETKVSEESELEQLKNLEQANKEAIQLNEDEARAVEERNSQAELQQNLAAAKAKQQAITSSNSSEEKTKTIKQPEETSEPETEIDKLNKQLQKSLEEGNRQAELQQNIYSNPEERLKKEGTMYLANGATSKPSEPLITPKQPIEAEGVKQLPRAKNKQKTDDKPAKTLLQSSTSKQPEHFHFPQQTGSSAKLPDQQPLKNHRNINTVEFDKGSKPTDRKLKDISKPDELTTENNKNLTEKYAVSFNEEKLRTDITSTEDKEFNQIMNEAQESFKDALIRDTARKQAEHEQKQSRLKKEIDKTKQLMDKATEQQKIINMINNKIHELAEDSIREITQLKEDAKTLKSKISAANRTELIKLQEQVEKFKEDYDDQKRKQEKNYENLQKQDEETNKEYETIISLITVNIEKFKHDFPESEYSSYYFDFDNKFDQTKEIKKFSLQFANEIQSKAEGAKRQFESFSEEIEGLNTAIKVKDEQLLYQQNIKIEQERQDLFKELTLQREEIKASEESDLKQLKESQLKSKEGLKQIKTEIDDYTKAANENLIKYSSKLTSLFKAGHEKALQEQADRERKEIKRKNQENLDTEARKKIKKLEQLIENLKSKLMENATNLFKDEQYKNFISLLDEYINKEIEKNEIIKNNIHIIESFSRLIKEINPKQIKTTKEINQVKQDVTKEETTISSSKKVLKDISNNSSELKKDLSILIEKETKNMTFLKNKKTEVFKIKSMLNDLSLKQISKDIKQEIDKIEESIQKTVENIQEKINLHETTSINIESLIKIIEDNITPQNIKQKINQIEESIKKLRKELEKKEKDLKEQAANKLKEQTKKRSKKDFDTRQKKDQKIKKDQKNDQKKEQELSKNEKRRRTAERQEAAQRQKEIKEAKQREEEEAKQREKEAKQREEEAAKQREKEAKQREEEAAKQKEAKQREDEAAQQREEEIKKEQTDLLLQQQIEREAQKAFVKKDKKDGTTQSQLVPEQKKAVKTKTFENIEKFKKNHNEYNKRKIYRSKNRRLNNNEFYEPIFGNQIEPEKETNEGPKARRDIARKSTKKHRSTQKKHNEKDDNVDKTFYQPAMPDQDIDYKQRKGSYFYKGDKEENVIPAPLMDETAESKRMTPNIFIEKNKKVTPPKKLKIVEPLTKQKVKKDSKLKAQTELIRPKVDKISDKLETKKSNNFFKNIIKKVKKFEQQVESFVKSLMN